jgi:hypothetical protein
MTNPARAADYITIEVIGGVEGSCLAINDYRCAGPKPWGGGRTTRTWKVKRETFIRDLIRAGVLDISPAGSEGGAR